MWVFLFHLIQGLIIQCTFHCPLKTSENRKVFWCFQGVENRCNDNEWVNRRKSFCMLSSERFIALLILPFLISRINFLDISTMVNGVLDTLKSFWMVSASFNSSMISPACHSFIRFSNDFKWSFDFDFREGFSKRRLGITIISLTDEVTSFNGDSCIHSFISLEISSMKFIPACPNGVNKY